VAWRIITYPFLLVALVSQISCDSDSQDACSDIGLNSKIMQGTKCEENGSPVVLLELREDGDKAGYCSGTIIGERAVLSAAHCVHDIDSVKVSVGNEKIESFTFYEHPEAEIDDQYIEDPANDLSVIILPRSAGVRSLPILKSRSLFEGEEFSIFGYGISDNGDDDKDLRSGLMNADEIEDGHIESEYTDSKSSICFGDSGGPAIVTEGGDASTAAIVGVASAISQSIIPGGGDGIIPGLPLQGAFGPLPFPIFGSSCSEGDRTFHASVQTEEAINFIQRYVPDLKLR